MKRKPGRPPRAARAATERVEIRATKAEVRAWSRLAEHAEVTLSEWIRQRCNPPPRVEGV